MITRIEYRSADGLRRAIAFTSSGAWFVKAKKDTGHEVAVWSLVSSQEIAQRVCDEWVDHGRIASDPIPAWSHFSVKAVAR